MVNVPIFGRGIKMYYEYLKTDKFIDYSLATLQNELCLDEGCCIKIGMSGRQGLVLKIKTGRGRSLMLLFAYYM